MLAEGEKKTEKERKRRKEVVSGKPKGGNRIRAPGRRTCTQICTWKKGCSGGKEIKCLNSFISAYKTWERFVFMYLDVSDLPASTMTFMRSLTSTVRHHGPAHSELQPASYTVWPQLYPFHICKTWALHIIILLYMFSKQIPPISPGLHTFKCILGHRDMTQAVQIQRLPQMCSPFSLGFQRRVSCILHGLHYPMIHCGLN